MKESVGNEIEHISEEEYESWWESPDSPRIELPNCIHSFGSLPEDDAWNEVTWDDEKDVNSDFAAW